ncbi:small acid-soluble spore protein I (minor) [Marininema mesophilum]|uniref:Small, acid-soluble spore protein I n=1 Tax=Marininema mesophilum TaxID=1048340 RepID=A0A1H3CN25_9BACL|nr:small acid-soluble spore protein SspI [Marininema mesophilum]SDX55440.1 small acid-soluble spore protein I (minor) [Marininema mesophilum]
MNFPIRGAVYHNIKDMDVNELRDMVVDSIKSGDEKLLPGLGVLFEVIWQSCDQSEQDRLMNILHEHIPREKAQPPVAH